MIQIITGSDAALGQWVGEHLGINLGPGAGLGFAEDGRLLAGIFYNHFCWPSIEASIYAISPRWMTRRTLHWAFAYPFRQLRCRRLGAATASGNRRARKMLEGLGFRLEGVIRDGLPTGDACIYGLLARECRWLRDGRLDLTDVLGVPPEPVLTPGNPLLRVKAA